MSRVLYENESLKLVESENIYFLISDAERMRVVFNEDCKIDRVCVKKMKDVGKIQEKLSDDIYKMLKGTYDGTVDGMCDLIDKHIIKNHNAMVDCLTDEEDYEMALAHSGAITGLIMLRKEIYDMHSDGD